MRSRCRDKMTAHLHWGSGFSSQPSSHTPFSQPSSVPIMDPKSQRRHDGILSSLNVAIEAMTLAKEVSSISPAKAVFGSVSIVLTMIRVRPILLICLGQPPAHKWTQDSMVNKMDYVNLGLACADVCRALDRGIKGRQLSELSQSVSEAIAQLTK